ncbi:MAG: gamma-glutamyl-gamma-aminobutyrate hydrolase family protein [Solirubrobacteraceae bacterium]
MAGPLVLVNCWRRELPTYLGERTRLDTLDPAYAEGVSDAGGRPLLVSRPPGTAADLETIAGDLIALADGLLLTGGGDVDPASYGAARDNVDAEDPLADAFELALIAAARAARLPTLAVCRGAQLLAVAHGGRLAQRVGADSGHAEMTGVNADEILSARHPVQIAPGSRAATALGLTTAEVNTIHHHLIADPGELEVTATAPGGVIEAVEPHSEWECLGVQWHPEKMGQWEPFEWLVREAKRRQQRGSGSSCHTATTAATAPRATHTEVAL